MSDLTKSPQILNHPQTRLPIRNRRVEVMLLALLIHRETLKVYHSSGSKLRLYRTGNVNGRLHSKLLHSVLHDAELERDDARHLNRAAETDFSVSLREVQVPDAELCAFDVHR